MAIQVGDKVPDIELQLAKPEGPEAVRTGELFAGKKTVLFAVPGAFTPVCSAQHLPGFIDKAAEILAKGVDQIACVSVNDAFVMDAWALDKGARNKLIMLADGSAAFTRALGFALILSPTTKWYLPLINPPCVVPVAFRFNKVQPVDSKSSGASPSSFFGFSRNRFFSSSVLNGLSFLLRIGFSYLQWIYRIGFAIIHVSLQMNFS